MSILDLGFSSEEEFKEQLQAAAPSVDAFAKETGLADNNCVKLLQAGYSLKEIYGLTEGELEALFQSGYQALSVGDVENAKAVFSKLCQLDPLDPRFPFAFAASAQIEGNISLAAKTYLLALSMDALNVDGYVRLGECLIAAGETEEAREVLEIAIALVGRGHGDEDVKAQAERLLETLPESEAPESVADD